jgi:hypothetical protein
MSTRVEARNLNLLFDARVDAPTWSSTGSSSPTFTPIIRRAYQVYMPQPNCCRLPSADEKRHWIFWGPVGIDNVARGIESMLTDNNRFHVAGGEAVADATYITVHQLSEATGMWA